MQAETVIYKARTILTMDPSCPRATHVAVREGRVLAVGDEATCRVWGPARLDESFADLVLMGGSAAAARPNDDAIVDAESPIEE